MVVLAGVCASWCLGWLLFCLFVLFDGWVVVVWFGFGLVVVGVWVV